jgi:hypothetical protein
MLAYNQLQCAPLVQPARHGWAPRSYFSSRYTEGNRVIFTFDSSIPQITRHHALPRSQIPTSPTMARIPSVCQFLYGHPVDPTTPTTPVIFGIDDPPPPVAALAGTTPRDATVRPRMRSLCPAGRVRRQRRAWPRGRRRCALPVGWPALRRRGGRPRGSRPWRRPCP